MRHFLYPIERADVIQRVDTGRQAAVQAEDLVVNQRRQGQVVEKIGEELPHIRIAVFAQALVVEAVDLGDLAGLVVAAQDGDALRVADLEGDEQRHRFHREVAAVHVVAHEEVVGVRVGPADLEELHQVVELAVDVAAHGDGAFDGLHVGLVLQHLARFLAQPSHFVFRELLALHQVLDPAVEGGDGGRVGRCAQAVLDLARILHVRVPGRLPQCGSLHVRGVNVKRISDKCSI